jgi:hypothetical protein
MFKVNCNCVLKQGRKEGSEGGGRREGGREEDIV